MGLKRRDPMFLTMATLLEAPTAMAMGCHFCFFRVGHPPVIRFFFLKLSQFVVLHDLDDYDDWTLGVP